MLVVQSCDRIALKDFAVATLQCVLFMELLRGTTKQAHRSRWIRNECVFAGYFTFFAWLILLFNGQELIIVKEVEVKTHTDCSSSDVLEVIE